MNCRMVADAHTHACRRCGRVKLPVWFAVRDTPFSGAARRWLASRMFRRCCRQSTLPPYTVIAAACSNLLFGRVHYPHVNHNYAHQ